MRNTVVSSANAFNFLGNGVVEWIGGGGHGGVLGYSDFWRKIHAFVCVCVWDGSEFSAIGLVALELESSASTYFQVDPVVKFVIRKVPPLHINTRFNITPKTRFCDKDLNEWFISENGS